MKVILAFLLFLREKKLIPKFLIPLEPVNRGQTSSRKRTSAVWNEFDRIMVDGVCKAKCKKCAKLYGCSSCGGTCHLKRYQESHRMHDSCLQSILNIQRVSLVGNFAYNHENKKKYG